MSNDREPSAINAAFAEAFNTGSVDALLALYEPDALLVGPGGEELRGHEAIRTELQRLVATGGRMTSVNRYAFVSGNIALLSAEYKLVIESPGGEPAVIEGRTAEVVRRQPDGRWLYVLDHPAGA